jgi:hypothetical protein
MFTAKLGSPGRIPLRISIKTPPPKYLVLIFAQSTKFNRTENLTTYACCLAPGGLTDKENQVKINIKYRFRYNTENSKDPDLFQIIGFRSVSK